MQAEGSPHALQWSLWGRNGKVRRSAQAQRGRLGSGLRARGAELPLGKFGFNALRESANSSSLLGED